jgi:hypothetical protein
MTEELDTEKTKEKRTRGKDARKEVPVHCPWNPNTLHTCRFRVHPKLPRGTCRSKVSKGEKY